VSSSLTETENIFLIHDKAVDEIFQSTPVYPDRR
jgi:hypothetical protein